MVFYPTTIKLSNILTKAVEPADTQSSRHYIDGLAQWQRGREVRLPPSHLSKSQESSEPCITCQKYPKQNAPTYKDLPIGTGLSSNQQQMGRITSWQPLVRTKTIIAPNVGGLSPKNRSTTTTNMFKQVLAHFRPGDTLRQTWSTKRSKRRGTN